MIYGYARDAFLGSSKLEHQVLQLQRCGATEIVCEFANGLEEKPQLEALVSRLQEGDTLFITDFERLGRAQEQVNRLLGEIETRKANIVIIEQLNADGLS